MLKQIFKYAAIMAGIAVKPAIGMTWSVRYDTVEPNGNVQAFGADHDIVITAIDEKNISFNNCYDVPQTKWKAFFHDVLDNSSNHKIQNSSLCDQLISDYIGITEKRPGQSPVTDILNRNALISPRQKDYKSNRIFEYLAKDWRPHH